MNISNFYDKDSEDLKAKIGFKVGVGAEYTFTDIWSIQPSLFFGTKGAKYDQSIGSEGISMKVNAMYLELPMNAQARFAVVRGVNITIAADPYFAIGVGGKTEAEIRNSSFKASSETRTFGDEEFDRFDARLEIGVGAEFGRIMVGLDGQCGLAKLVSDSDTSKQLNFSITLGYKF